MVLVDPAINPTASWEFEADVVILHHSTSIKANYEPVIQCMTLRQTARLVNVGEKEILRTGDRSHVTFRFCYHPEYIKPGMRIIFREGSCKGIGILSSVNNIAATDEGTTKGGKKRKQKTNTTGTTTTTTTVTATATTTATTKAPVTTTTTSTKTHHT